MTKKKASKKADETKMSLKSMDLAAEKRRQLKVLFPEVFGEDKIDFAHLKKILGMSEEPDVHDEHFGLQWAGKAECMRATQQRSVATLKPARDESANFDATENLFIEGDNLEVLNLLRKSYFGKVKMIYIDPPYNTGKEFIYPDDYSETLDTYLKYTGQMDGNGRKFSTNTDTDGRFHSNWLSMMYPRLYFAGSLLRDDGVIFISIDHHEQANLRILCNQIFGEDNFIANLHVEMSTTQGMKVAAAQKGDIAKNAEMILCYCKNRDYFQPVKLLYVSKPWDTHYSIFYDQDTGKSMSLRDFLRRDDKFKNLCEKNQVDINKIDVEKLYEEKWFRDYIHSISDKVWQDAMCDINANLNGKQKKQLENGKFIKYQAGNRDYILKMTQTGVVRQLLSLSMSVGETDDFSATYGARKIRGDWWGEYYKDMMNINKEGDIEFKNGKKPIRLIRDLLKISTQSDDIILDFFAGSATTAHAVMQLNAKDKGNRKYICIQLPEPTDKKLETYNAGYKTIAEIGKERIRRAAKKIGKEYPDYRGDRGFKVFKLQPSNFKVWDSSVEKSKKELQQQLLNHVRQIEESSTHEDILYELLLKSGELLTVKVEKIKLAGKAVFSVDGASGKIFVCLEDKLNEKVIDAMASNAPQRVICLDKGFNGNDQLMANAVQTFKRKKIAFKTV